MAAPGIIEHYDVLSDLPTELKLHILSYLPVTNIARCRGISGHFKDLIDDQGNTPLLLKRYSDHDAARLRYEITSLESFDVLPTLSGFILMLQKFFAHRRIFHSMHDRMRQAIRFAESYSIRQNKSLFAPEDMYCQLWRLVFAILSIQVRHEISNKTEELIDWVEEPCPPPIREIGIDTPQKMERLFNIARRGLFVGVPEREIISFDSRQLPVQVFLQWAEGQSHNLEKVLGIPLPKSHWRYHLTHSWSFALLRCCMMTSDTRTLNPLHKAALLEELFVL